MRLFRRNNDLNEELQAHLRMAMKDRIEAGESPEEARLAARREFGNLGLIKETTRDIHGWTNLETWWKDLKFAARVLAKNRTFSGMAILALTLGIGANTAIFTVVNAVLLRPLPYPNSHQLTRLWDSFGTPGNTAPVSYPNFADWRAWNHSFSDLAAFKGVEYVLTGTGEPAHLQGVTATANLFPLLGVHPALGRNFLPSEDRPHANHGTDSIIISHALWQGRFGLDPHILGRTLHLDGQLFTVVGVMPRKFNSQIGTAHEDFWTTAAVLAEPSPGMDKPLSEQRGMSFLGTVGRLKPGISISQAQADMDHVASLLMRQDPKGTTREGVIVQSLKDSVTGDSKPLLLLLFGVAGTVFLLVCADVAGLVLARTARRQRELTIRSAVGATRWRIVRLLLVESAVLTTIALVLAVGIAAVVIQSLRIALDLPASTSTTFDSRVFGFAFGIAVLAAVIFSIAPVIETLRIDANFGLKESSPSAGASRRQIRLQNFLITGQIALTMLLLSACGLFTVALIRLQHVDLGFRPDHVLAIPVDLPDGKYNASQRANWKEQLIGSLSQLPQVVSASTGSSLPLDGQFNNTVLDNVAGRRIPENKWTGITFASVTPHYFRTLRIPLKTGREFQSTDTSASLPVVILNEAAVRKYFGSQDPIGQQVEPMMWPGSAGTTCPRTVVGIAADVKIGGIGEAARPMIYWPSAQIHSGTGFYTIVHTTIDPLRLLSSITAQLHSLDKNLPLDRAEVLTESVSNSLALPRHYTALIASFAGLAILLTAIGLYGIVAYTTAQRTQEIGVRIALGATPANILIRFLRQGFIINVTGIGIGLLLSVAAARVLNGALFGIPAEESFSLTAAGVFLLVVTMAAIYIPARRGANIDPVNALRHE